MQCHLNNICIALSCCPDLIGFHVISYRIFIHISFPICPIILHKEYTIKSIKSRLWRCFCEGRSSLFPTLLTSAQLRPRLSQSLDFATTHPRLSPALPPLLLDESNISPSWLGKNVATFDPIILFCGNIASNFSFLSFLLSPGSQMLKYEKLWTDESTFRNLWRWVSSNHARETW